MLGRRFPREWQASRPRRGYFSDAGFGTAQTDATILGFAATGATDTYGLNAETLPGAGTLTFRQDGYAITLTQFRWTNQGVDGNIDRVGTFAHTPNGILDYTGQFTVNVRIMPSPSASLTMGMGLIPGAIVLRRRRKSPLQSL